MHRPVLDEAKWGFVLLTVFVYWVSYVALNQPEVFIVIRSKASEEVSVKLNPEVITKLKVLRKYKGSGLSQAESHRIISRLKNLVITNKPHLNPEITIEELAGLIPCQRHHLSQVLNESFGQTFYDFINNLRVSEVKHLLSDPLTQQTKIIALAYKAGFNSISTFNEVFKRLPFKLHLNIVRIPSWREGRTLVPFNKPVSRRLCDPHKLAGRKCDG